MCAMGLFSRTPAPVREAEKAARRARERGDVVHQVLVTLTGDFDVNELLNAVARAGWELIGHDLIYNGQLVGASYLFRRTAG
jgi:hypothetical protein